MSTTTALLPTNDDGGVKEGNKYLRANNIMSLGFFGIFFAFNTVQAFQSQLNETLGYICLGSLYGAFTLVAIIGPKIVDMISPKWAMIGGGIPYVLVMLANLYPKDYILIPANILTGIGAAIIWNGEGVYVGRCALHYSQVRSDITPEGATSMFNGRFFAVMQFTGTTGTLIGSLILSLFDNRNIMFGVMAAAAVLGIIAIFFLPDVSAPEHVEKPKRVGVAETLTLVIKSRIMQLMIPVIFFNGMSLGYMFSDFMKYIAGAVVGSNHSGFVIATFYLVNSIASFFFGKVASTSFGRKGLCMVATVSTLVFTILLTIWNQPHENNNFIGYFVTISLSCLFGIGDAVWESQIPAILQSIYDDDVDINAAVSNYKMWQSLGFTCQFVIGIFLKNANQFWIKSLILVVLQFVSAIFLFYLHYKVASLDKSSPALRESLMDDKMMPVPAPSGGN